MLPKLKPGHSVVTLNWFYNLKLGDIVVAKVENKLIIKRIQKVENRRYFLKGDNKLDSKDFGWVKSSQIIGKVVFVL